MHKNGPDVQAVIHKSNQLLRYQVAWILFMEHLKAAITTPIVYFYLVFLFSWPIVLILKGKIHF